jgi:hypothetical protein
MLRYCTLKVTLPWDFFWTVLEIDEDLLKEEDEEEVDEALEARCSTILRLVLVSLKAIMRWSSSQPSSCG